MEQVDQSQSRSEMQQPEPPLRNYIKLTRKIIGQMTELQRFQKAKAHIFDSLTFKHPRPASQALNTPWQFRLLYSLQSSAIWNWLLFFIGYVFMYLVILDSESFSLKIGLQASILLIFWFDHIVIFYCRSIDHPNQHLSKFFYFKLMVIILMTIDLLVFIAVPAYGERPIRPFRILRAFVPLLFDAEYRKSLYSLASAYKDVIVFLIFFVFVVCAWALVGSRALAFDSSYRDPDYPLAMDPYKNNYSDLGKMIFIVWVTSSYDSYPDNQLLAIQNYQPNYIYFIVFIFLNMFVFSLIPGGLIYIKFRQTRSKIILVDQIRQKTSLILAFVTLAEDEANLTIQKLIKFLLYLYRYKIRYIEYITDICLRLDDNNNRSIQVSEFMCLSQILLQNSVMLPPTFDDVELWVRFRRFLIQTIQIKTIVHHWLFQLSVSIIIILSFINAIFLMFYNSAISSTFDSIFILLFLIELFIRIVAIGPQNFFMDRWNNVDASLVVFSVIFYFVNDTTGADSIVRMSRIFRIATFLRLVSHTHFLKGIRVQIFDKLKNIFTIILQILPIILKFIPLFLFFFYVFAIFGMQVFYNSYSTTGSPNYNQYQQFSSFRTFIQAQYIMVMVLTEAGWSQVAFDHSWRNPGYFGLVMSFFALMHLMIVYILAILIRGIFWQVFFTVNQIYSQRLKLSQEQQQFELENIRRAKQLQQIGLIIQNNQYIEPNTVIKRELIENKLDLEIFYKLKAHEEADRRRSSRNIIKSKRSFIVQKLMDDWHVTRKDFQQQQEQLHHQNYHEHHSQNHSQKSSRSSHSKISIMDIEEHDEQDFQSQIEDLLNKIILNPKIRFTEIVAYPKIFVEYLNQRFMRPQELICSQNFDLELHPLSNSESMYYHVYQIAALLNIQTSKREQKAMIIESLLDTHIIEEDTAEKLLKKTLQEKIFHIDTNGTLRKLFLFGTNQALIRKLQIQYFSDLYGYSFKHINKMTLEPLLKFEATLTYSLRNILRYPRIGNTQFFEMFTHIEDQLSNKLLKRGSLFKFVYKIDHESDIWFAIEYKRQQQMRIHFIKTGIWAYTKEMVDEQSYYARDVFNWDVSHRPDRKACEQYMKRFYQSFEGLAFSLLDQKQFFRSNPSKYIYDLYVESFSVKNNFRYKTKEIEISKIMVVILSKEEERADVGAKGLQYFISDIVNEDEEPEHQIGFNFEESDNETYQKLKNIAASDHQKILESEGLPFTYIVNLMKEISDIIKISGNNFIYQIEKVLNDQYESINHKENRDKEI